MSNISTTPGYVGGLVTGHIEPKKADPYKLPFAVRQDIAVKLAESHGLTKLYALQLVNRTLEILRDAAGVDSARKVCASPCMEGKRRGDGAWSGPCSYYPTVGVQAKCICPQFCCPVHTFAGARVQSVDSAAINRDIERLREVAAEMEAQSKAPDLSADDTAAVLDVCALYRRVVGYLIDVHGVGVPHQQTVSGKTPMPERSSLGTQDDDQQRNGGVK
jgi:hypothetical protein